MAEDTTKELLDILLGLPHAIADKLKALATLRERVAAKRAEVMRSKDELEQATAAATMAAWADGAINGKNQAERDVQLKMWLSGDAPTYKAQEAKTAAENALTRAELAAEATENEVKAMVYQVQAAQSAATLQAALISYEDTAMLHGRGLLGQGDAGVAQRDADCQARLVEMRERQAQRDQALSQGLIGERNAGPEADLFRR